MQLPSCFAASRLTSHALGSWQSQILMPAHHMMAHMQLGRLMQEGWFAPASGAIGQMPQYEPVQNDHATSPRAKVSTTLCMHMHSSSMGAHAMLSTARLSCCVPCLCRVLCRVPFPTLMSFHSSRPHTTIMCTLDRVAILHAYELMASCAVSCPWAQHRPPAGGGRQLQPAASPPVLHTALCSLAHRQGFGVMLQAGHDQVACGRIISQRPLMPGQDGTCRRHLVVSATSTIPIYLLWAVCPLPSRRAARLATGCAPFDGQLRGFCSKAGAGTRGSPNQGGPAPAAPLDHLSAGPGPRQAGGARFGIV